MIDDGLPEDEEMAGTGPKPTPETVPAGEPGVQFRADLSRGFTEWLATKRTSVAITTYQWITASDLRKSSGAVARMNVPVEQLWN